MPAQNNTMKTLHLIQSGDHCGMLKIALHSIGEQPYFVAYYPLPLSNGALPRSTSKTELQRVIREYRKIKKIPGCIEELEEFFTPDLSLFDRVVVWWSNKYQPDTCLILPLVCRLYPQCELYQVQYDDDEFYNYDTNHPDRLIPISGEERASYAAQYEELVRNETHLRIYADDQHLQIVNVAEDYFDKKILAKCKKATPIENVIHPFISKYRLCGCRWFIESRILYLHKEGKLTISDMEWFLHQYSDKNCKRDRKLLTIQTI